MQKNLYVEKIGTGDKIFFLPGLGMDSLSMKQGFEGFFKDQGFFERIYMDLPGSGKSSKDLCDADSSEILRLILNLIEEETNGEESFSIFAFSYGAYLARGISAIFSKAFKGNDPCCTGCYPFKKRSENP